MGTGWSGVDADSTLMDVLTVIDPDSEELDEEVATSTPPILVLQEGDDGFVVNGSLDELEKFGWRILRNVWAAKERERAAAPPPPAVTFDPDALRRWLTEPARRGVPDSYTRQVAIGLPLGPDAMRYGIEEAIEELLFVLAGSKEQRAWVVTSDVTDRVCAGHTLNGGNGKDGVVVTLGVGGDEERPELHLHAGHISRRDLLAGAPERDADEMRRDR